MKQLTLILLFVALIVCSGCQAIINSILEPDHKFSSQIEPAPDYSREEFWAALPQKQDMADATPWGERDLQAYAKVDVFFIHPTTYIIGEAWNQDLTNEDVNAETDRGPILNQASVFNSVAKVYAPRYRQAVLFSFFPGERNEEGDAALELAYKDVVAAFSYYLEHYNQGRPIIIAGHSQGANHGLRLLKEFFRGKRLREKLVAAYLIGAPIPKDTLENMLPDIPLSTSALQTQCVITWNTVEHNMRPERLSHGQVTVLFDGNRQLSPQRPLACVNPLTWSIDEETADRELHLGAALMKTPDDSPIPDRRMIWCRCRDGLLEVEVPKYRYQWAFFSGDYHLMDYQLFYVNIRRNIEERVEIFLQNFK